MKLSRLRGFAMRRWLALLAMLTPCTGCLYYAYPTAAYTPDLTIDNRDGSAHAFRVDIDRTERKGAATSSEYTLTRIPVDTRGFIPSQLEIAPVTGVYNPLGMGDFKEHETTKYTMTIRVYRPGYRTIEVKAWDKSRPLDWVKVADFAEQEKAIDDLLADPEVHSATPGMTQFTQLGEKTWWDQKDSKTPPLGLQKGYVSPSQRASIEFAANEYSRLANGQAAASSEMAATRTRLQAKAIWLKKYAVEPPTP